MYKSRIDFKSLDEKLKSLHDLSSDNLSQAIKILEFITSGYYQSLSRELSIVKAVNSLYSTKKYRKENDISDSVFIEMNELEGILSGYIKIFEWAIWLAKDINKISSNNNL